MKSLRLLSFSKYFGKKVIYKNVTLEFPETGFILIFGDSGAGKSTLFEVLSGIDIDYLGKVEFFGNDWKELSEKERSNKRYQEIGFLRQSYDLLPLESALENVLLGLRGYPLKEEERKVRGLSLLNKFGLLEKRESLALYLSGGEKERLALARALINDPTIIIGDEPTGALDKKNALLVLETLKEISKKRLVIVSSHDLKLFLPYADEVLEIKNCKIHVKKPLKIKDKRGKAKRKKEEKISFKFSYWLKHALHTLKERRFKNAVSIFLFSFSFLIFGLSIYLKDNVGEKIYSAFSSLSKEGMISLKGKNESQKLIGDFFSAKKEDVISLAKEFSSDICVSYNANFEDLFPDQNGFYVKKGVRREYLPSLSARSINDYLPLSFYSNFPIYPSKVITLERDEVVLGLPAKDLDLFARTLQVERTYEGVGKAIAEGDVSIYLDVENQNWQYFDRERFLVKGILAFSVPTLFHFDSCWNEVIFEDVMRFPSTLDKKKEYPWTLEKIYGLRGILNEEEFLSISREEKYSSYLFERDSSFFDLSHNDKEVNRLDLRYFVYLVDRLSLHYQKVKKLANYQGVSSFSLLGESSYIALPEALCYGFKEPFIVGNKRKEVEEIGDILSKVETSNINVFPEEQNDILVGSYLKGSSSLTYSSDFRNLESGNIPIHLDEIGLSIKAYEKLGKPRTIILGGAIEAYIEGKYLRREYRYKEVKITGVFSSNEEILYASPFWTIDFFKSQLGMKAIYLEPQSALFYLKDPSFSISFQNYCSSIDSSLKIIDPSLIIKESINSVLSYISTILLFASVLILLSSFFLLIVLSLIEIEESKKEGLYLYLIGISREEILSSYSAKITLPSLLGFFNGAIGIIFLEFFFDEALSELFAISLPFSFSFKPLHYLLLVFLISFSIINLFLAFIIKRSKFHLRGEGEII